MAYTDSAMMGGSMRAPLVNKSPRPNGKPITTVRIANFEDWSRNRFSFRDQQSEFSLRRLHHRKQSHRPVFDGHFYREPLPHFAVINTQRLYFRLAFRDGD